VLSHHPTVACFRFRRNVFTEQLASNDRGVTHTDTQGKQANNRRTVGAVFVTHTDTQGKQANNRRTVGAVFSLQSYQKMYKDSNSDSQE
jgi:hypothetical protein